MPKFNYTLMTILKQGEHPTPFKEVSFTSPAGPGTILIIDDKEVFHVQSLFAQVPENGIVSEHMGLVGNIIARKGANGEFSATPPPAASRIIVPGR